MLVKIVLLSVLSLLLVLPILLDKKLFAGSSADHYPKLLRLQEKNGNRQSRWKGPKTDERINRMLAECIELMNGLGVPISKDICPEVVLTGSRSYYGRCSPKGSLKRYNQYDFYIEISGHTLGNTEKSLRNTLIHELIHTVPGGLCHTGEWKKWAKFVSEKTEYTIQHYDGDTTWKDRDRLRGYTDWLNA